MSRQIPSYHQWVKQSVVNSDIYPDDLLNINKMNIGMLDEGPGIRNAVFLQGCYNFCPGCRNISTKGIKSNKLISPVAASKYLTRIPQLKFAVAGVAKKKAYKKLLILNAIRHILWELLNNLNHPPHKPCVPIQDYYSLALEASALLKRLVKGVPAQQAPESWTAMPVMGVTISGGEPLIQPIQVMALIEQIKKSRPEWNICLYSGSHSLTQMIDDPTLKSVVEMTDMIKTGGFQWEHKSVAHFYYGSTNQAILDTKKSLASRSPIPAKLPKDLEIALKISTYHQREKLTPCLNDHFLKIIQMIQLDAYNIYTFEEFEALFGEINENIIHQLFDFFPQPKQTHIPVMKFLGTDEINFCALNDAPTATTELGCIELLLQGSTPPPAVDINPALCHLRPGKMLTESTLFQHINTIPHWYLNTEKQNHELNYLRLNMALQDRLLQVQSTYFLLKSPCPDMSVQDYHLIIDLYRKQLRLFFNQTGIGMPLKKSVISIRLGDPLLQANTLELFCKRARKVLYEIWIEIPHRLKDILKTSQAGKLIHNSDYLVCGKPFKRQYPSVLPFKSSMDQQIIKTDTMEPWVCRFDWSKQITQYETSFSSPQAIARFKLPNGIIQYFKHHLPGPVSIEAFEKQTGQISMDWEQSGSPDG